MLGTGLLVLGAGFSVVGIAEFLVLAAGSLEQEGGTAFPLTQTDAFRDTYHHQRRFPLQQSHVLCYQYLSAGWAAFAFDMEDQHINLPAEIYSPLFETTVDGKTLSAWDTAAPQDDGWDRFLQGTPLGEFQQASFWARYKGIDDWKCSRFVLIADSGIAGGFQVLWRKSRFGRIGYVSKGPVAEPEDEKTIRVLVKLLTLAARRLGLVAMVIQPSGQSRTISSHLTQRKFVLNRLLGIITANLIVDVSKGVEALESALRRTTRQQIRKAIRSGVSVRQGDERDLGVFFELMLETCKRQGVAPNPSSQRALVELWKASQDSGGCRLTLADWDGHPISGLFCIPFGQTVTLWKKGSLPEHLHLHSMELLYHEALEWAHQRGYRYCDFLGLNREIAEALLEGKPLSDEQKGSRDVFNLGFGGQPVLLPEAFFFFPNPLLRAGYRLLIRNDFILRHLERLAGIT